jgi:hypothetical protein
VQPLTRARDTKRKRLAVAPDVRAVLREVAQEVMRARGKHPVFNSAHEGYAVLLEEVDELWTEIKIRQRDPLRLRAEAVQVAAMAVRFLTDVNN